MLYKTAFHRSILVLLAFLLSLPLIATPGEDTLSKDEKEQLEETLNPKHRQWLAEVRILITEPELKSFLELGQDYQRDAFIRQFWRVRDPYPGTARNEFKSRYYARVNQVSGSWGFEDERSKVFLLNGPPSGQLAMKCGGELWPLEVWFFDGTERTREEFFLIFYDAFRRGHFEIWEPSSGLHELFQNASFDQRSGALLGRISRACFDPDPLLRAISHISNAGMASYPILVAGLMEPPEPLSGEWLATFGAYSTDLPENAETFEADLGFGYPGRRQSRTVTQITVSPNSVDLSLAELAESQSYNLVINGEILLGDELFDRFRYRFDLPKAQVSTDKIPLVLQRYLRPGSYRLLLKLEDINNNHYFRADQVFEVPKVARTEAPPPPDDPESAALLEEANSTLSNLETTVKILPTSHEIQVGRVRFDTLVTGANVDRVRFLLEEKVILTKRRAPFSVELDLGNLPQSQTLSVEALDAEGQILSDDELLINASAHRFALRVVEPRSGEKFNQSVRVVADLQVPEGQTVDRMEILFNDERVATLYQPPWEQPLKLTEPGALAYIRLVAYLKDGNSTDDDVFINAPPGLEQIEVDLVELYTSVLDGQGRPVQGLEGDRFVIEEDGVPQELRRFEKVENLPITAMTLIDISASMEGSIDQAQDAALSFFEEIITPKDRAAVVTFNDRPNLTVKLTNQVSTLAAGLAGLKAERGTALYDAVVFGLFYFNGVRGQRALLLLSDGKDESSRFEWDQALDFARRAGVTIFSIGLDLPKSDFESKRRLKRLAEETGGRAFFVEDAGELKTIYQQIEQELRFQYLLTYQSTNNSTAGEFRSVKVDVKKAGAEAKTLRGYYP